MYRNRMNELAKLLPDPSVIGSKLRNDPLSDLLAEPAQQSIYAQAEERVRKIKEVTLNLERSGREYFKSTRPEKQKSINDTINRKISEGNTLMNELKPLLKQIDEEYKSESAGGDNSHLVEWKAVKNGAADAFTAFREAQEKISEDMKETIHRQANLVQGKEISAQELENLVLHPEKGQDMLKEKLLDSPSVQLENCVSDIIDKCNDVLKLEKSMRECLSMMEELGMLVHLQGEKLLLIEDVIGGASDYITKGEIDLEKGKESHKKAKKKMCCVMLLMLTIVGIIVIPIVITQLK